jgi:hypothetical protein
MNIQFLEDELVKILMSIMSFGVGVGVVIDG